MIASVVVLVVNDRLLKRAYPGFITGKLSDVAGLVVAPPLLAFVVAVAFRIPAGRPADRLTGSCVAVTGIGFALAKGTPSGAVFASQVWTMVAGPSRVVCDPSDLLALPVLGVSWLLWTQARIRPASSRGVRLARVIVVVPLTMLAVGATSAVEPHVAGQIEYFHGRVFADLPAGVAASSDGGLSWQAATDQDRLDVADPGASTSEGLQTVVRSAATACVPDVPQHCYRVAGELRVEETTDGGATWSVAWEVSAGRRQFLARTDSSDDPPAGDEAVGYRSTSLLIVPQIDGYTVIVANGSDGLLVRDAEGQWTREGFPLDVGSLGAVRPLTGLGKGLMWEYPLAAVAGWWCLWLGHATARCLRAGGRGTGVSIVRGAGGLGLLLVVANFARKPPLPLLTFVIFGGVFFVLMALSTAWRSPSMSPRLWTRIAAVAAGTAALVAAPYLGWTLGYPDDYAVATVIAAVVFLIGAVIAFVFGYQAGFESVRLPPPSVVAATPQASRDLA